MEGGVCMRIEAYTQVQQLYQTKKTTRAEKAVKGSFSDQVQISSMGKDIQTAKNAVANTADIREEITTPIKNAVANGSYQVNEESFAAKLFEKYNEMR